MAKIGKIKKPVEPTEVDIFAGTLTSIEDQLGLALVDFGNYAEYNDIDDLTAKFVEANPSLLLVSTAGQWLMASKIVRKQLEQPTIEVVFQALLNGALGKDNGEKLYAHYKEVTNV